MPEDLMQYVQTQRADIAAANGEQSAADDGQQGNAPAGDTVDQNDANSGAHDDNATPVDGGGEEDPDAQAEQQLRRGKNHYARRIDKLTRDASELREQNAALTRIVEQALVRQQGAQPQAAGQPAPQADKGPQREDYADFSEYLEARQDWKAQRAAQQAQHGILAALAQAAQRAQVQNASHQIATEFQTKLAEGSRAFEDWDEVKESDLPIGNAGPAITMAENPAAVIHWLHRNPDELRRISTLNPLQAALAVGKISASLSKQSAPALSNAPRPGKPANARGGVPGGIREDMSMEEFASARSKARR